MKNVKLLTTSAPHLRTQDSTRKIMIDVLIALAPATIAATFFFGMYALVLSTLGMISAELIELFIMRVLRKDKNFVPNGSAAVTGLLLALNVQRGNTLVGTTHRCGLCYCYREARVWWTWSEYLQPSTRGKGVLARFFSNLHDDMV